MHGPIRDQLENLLANEDLGPGRTGVASHLANCPDCSGTLEEMRTTMGHLRALKAQEELEVSAGFYAKVLQKIEQRTSISVWAAFLRSPFSKRLAYGSLSAALILGAYVITEESRDGHFPGDAAAAVQQTQGPNTRVFGSQAEQRDAVLVNFASYEGSPQ